MLLAIDVGNTNTVFALCEGEKLRHQWRAATSTVKTADEYAVWLQQLMKIAGFAFTDVTGCIIATVVPQSLFHLRNLCRRYFNVEPMIVETQTVPGIEVRIRRPSDAGADRLVTAVGAFSKYGGPLIVVDSGTATTFDIVGKDGAFEGGVIAPGINLSMQALHDAAAQLPRIAIKEPAAVIGKDTIHAMQSGVFWGYVSLIEGMIMRIKDEYAQPLRVVATGGVSSLFDGVTTKVDYFDANLTVHGLMEVYKRSKALGAVPPLAL